MTPTLMLVLAAVSFAAAVIMAVSAWDAPRSARPTRRTARLAGTAAIAIASGLLVLAVTRWVVAGAAASVAVTVARERWRTLRWTNRAAIDRIDAVATWCEQLRDLLHAHHGLIETVTATAATVPAAIQPDVARLASRLRRGDPAEALVLFAADVDDPTADLAANVLLTAFARSGRTAEVLSELALAARDRAGMRMKVEAERAGDRTEARLVLIVAVVALVGVTLLGRDSRYLAVYRTGDGQVVLSIVFAGFGAGIALLGRLSRYERPDRVLGPARSDA